MKNPAAFRVWAPAILLGMSAVSPLVCISASGQTAASSTQANTQALLDGARTLEDRGRLDLAEQKWQQVLLTDPNNTEALAGVARAEKSAGRLAVANEYIERLRAISPNDPGIARAERMSTAKDDSEHLRQAGRLAQQGQYAAAMNVYRQVYGENPPPGDIALAYYETESATEEGRPHAIAGLRSLVAKFPSDSRYQVALGRILTYNPKTREEGRHLLEAHPNDPEANEALRQSLLWDAQNPATAGEIQRYLARHPDATLSGILRNEPRGGRTRPLTAEERAAAAVNATRTAEDREAYRLLNAGHLADAEERFKAILAKTPEEPNALAGMGYIRMQQANFGGAISFLAQAKQDGSRDPGLDAALATSRFWYTMGEAAMAVNDDNLPAAENQYRIALGMRPNSPEALDALGGTLLKAQQFDAAVPVFTQYTRLKPSAAHAWRGLFLAVYGTGNGAKALAVERQMPNPVRAELMKDPLYLRTLASAYSSAGRDADAQRVLRAALELPFAPDARNVETDTRLQFAGLLQQANRFDQAAGLYRQVLAKDPNNVSAYQGLVRVQHTAGEDDQALQTIEAMPPDVYTRAMRDSGFDLTVASIYQAENRLEIAQDILEKTLENEAASGARPPVSVQIQLAGVYLQRGNPQQAYPLYQQILAQHPDNLNAWKGLIDTLHTTGRDPDALAQVQQVPPAIRLQLESDVNYLQTVAAIYNALGQPQEAQVFLRRVEAHYAAEHIAPPAEVEIQNAWLMYNSGNDAGLWRQLMQLGSRPGLTDAQRRTVQTIWTNFAVRRANQAAAAGDDRKAIAILNSTAHAFPGNPAVIKALAGGYARAGMAKQAVAIWKSMDLRAADVDDYRSAVGAALAANDEKDAETWLRFALNRYPRNPELLVLGAKFEEERGDTNRARDYYVASLKLMPAEDSGQALATELSRPAPAEAALPGSTQATQDLSTLLAPGSNPSPATSGQSMVPPPPYLPGSYQPSAAPVQVAPASMPPYDPGQTADPSARNPLTTPAATPTPRLRDYVPQARLEPSPSPSRLAAQPAAVSAAAASDDSQPALSPATFQHQQIVRLTRRAAYVPVILTQQPVDRPAVIASTTQSGLSQGATFRSAAFHPQQSQQPQAQQPLTTQPSGQNGGQNGSQNGGQNPSPPATNGVVYGPYVPYVPPAKRAASKQQPQPQVPQPAQPLTTRPVKPSAPAPAVPATSDVVYGPYIPYQPPPPTSVQLGATPPTRQIKQPEVTDVLPTAKYSPNSSAGVPEKTHPAVSSQSAAAARRRASRAAAATGTSRPPAEDILTTPAEPPPYVPTPAASQPAPSQPAVFTQPAIHQAVQQTSPPASSQPSQPASNLPQANGDSYGQQYPQPHTAASAPAARSRVRHARPSAVASGASSAPAANPVPEPGPALSYPGVGSPLGYQPYPVIGPAYPLPAAPTDYDLLQKQVPPLRGPYYTGQPLAPQVPLTERQQTERDLAQLEASYSGWLGGTGSTRYRSGVVGYDRLTDLETTFEASYVAGNSVRFSVVPRAVFLNSGQLNVGNYTGVTGSPVLGTYNTAVAANNPTEQFANGIGGEIQATAHNFALALGYTPYEFLVENVTGRALWRPNNNFSLFLNRDAVNESQLSYAGLRDPGSATAVYPGNIWGGVVQTGGGVRFELGDERAGFYISGDGADLTGYHVLQNTKFEGSMGAYFLAHTFPGYGRLNVGVSLFGMHYAHEERQLSYGLGGYFSPDAYFLASVPITFVGRYKSNFHYSVAGALGVQTFQEDSQVYFPLDRGIQTGFATALNCTTATIANHTCGQYPTNSNTGGNYSINTEGAYRVADHWFAGGFLAANNTNNYNTVTAGFFVRYLFRPQVGTDDYPTGLFPIEGFRPLRVP